MPKWIFFKKLSGNNGILISYKDPPEYNVHVDMGHPLIQTATNTLYNPVTPWILTNRYINANQKLQSSQYITQINL